MKYTFIILLCLSHFSLKCQNMPIMTFETKSYHFGKVKMGEKPSFTFNFINTGDKPLNIALVSGCDCSDIEWSNQTILPQSKGFIKLTFNTPRLEAEELNTLLKKHIDIVLKELYPNKDYPISDSVTFEIYVEK